MHPNTTKSIETLVLGPMGWIWCIRCEKSRRDFVARNFALLAPVHPVLHRVSSSYKTIPNAPKSYEMLQFSMFCNKFYEVTKTIPNAHKHFETHQNTRLGSNGVDQVRWCEKLQRDFLARTFTLIEPVQYV